MTLRIHRAERADQLVAALGDLLRTPLADPFAVEIVSVPTPGVERWLSQRLAARLGATPGRTDGVCAALDFPSPRRLVARVLAQTGDAVSDQTLSAPAVSDQTLLDQTLSDDGSEDDPWQPHRAVWPLLRVIDAAQSERWAATLWAYLAGPGDSAPGSRRWSTARHLARLFARYAAARPAMIQAWSQGRDVDPSGADLPLELRWQAELWRRLRDELDRPGPAERLVRATAEISRSPGLLDLPERISLFGATRLDPDHLRVLAALAEHHEVHLWLPHPSPALWAAIQPHAAGRRIGPRAADRSETLAQHRLLAYLGRDSRELQLALAAAAPAATDDHQGPSDHPQAPDDNLQAPSMNHGPDDQRPDSLLHRLQGDIAANRGPVPLAERGRWSVEDRSVEFHASHGPDRQVDVLRERLVGLLADDPTLQPRDIVVMCPDIETFAPLIAASFGLDTDESTAEHPGHRLRVRLADRSLRQLNPLLGLVARLVALAESRIEATALLDLCAAAPVARRFGFSTDDLDRLQDLVSRSGVRWGLDPEHRARFGMGEFGQNTWAAGLDRLLLGVTMDEAGQHFIGTALPLDDVDSGDVDLVGRLSECVARVQQLILAFATPRPVTAWVELLKEAIDLLGAVAPADSWQLGHAYGELADLAESVVDGDGPELALAEVSALLTEAFRGRASRANFRTGTLTVCTMLPMRSVPHRVVCLLGVDEAVFPRRPRLDGDDVLELDPWVGDRDVRSEDRQMLLDAIMAAGERLVVVYAGRDARTGAYLPPAVPIGALLDSLEQTARPASGGALRDQLVTQHPLQPFDRANFTAEAGSGPFSFDRAALRGAEAASRPRHPPPPRFATAGLPGLPAARAVALADLIRFYNHPLRALLRERAALYVESDDTAPDEEIPTGLTGLDRWAVGNPMLQRHLHGQSLATLQAAEWRRGVLPPRAFGQQVLDSIVAEVAELGVTARPHLAEPAERRDVLLDLGPVRLFGVVNDLRGDTLLRVSFSRVSAKHRLQAWIELLALTVTAPERRWEALVIGRGGAVALGPVSSDGARMGLADLVDLQRVGLSGPIPLAPSTSERYASLRRKGQPFEAYQRPVEQAWALERDPVHERFFGPAPPLSALMAEDSLPSEARWDLAEPTRFGTLARRVFNPLLVAQADR